MGWYNSSWQYRVKVTIDSDSIDSTLSNFPVYVNLEDLPSNFHSHVNQTDARDIRITKADGTTELAREVVSYDSSTDTGELHFKADSISSSTDTDFYIYYGNSGASDYAIDATYGAENVWSNGYVGVYHAVNNGTDSTSNDNDASAVGNATHTSGGLFTDYFSFDNSGDYYSLGSISGLSGVDTFTVSSWYYLNSLTGDGAVFSIEESTNDLILWYNESGNENSECMTLNYGSTGSQGNRIDATIDSVATTWEMVHGVRDGSDRRIYINGVARGVDTGGSTGNNVIGSDARIGAWATTSNMDFDGRLAEIRISSSARSADWIDAEYTNSLDNSTTSFLTYSSEEQDVEAIDVKLGNGALGGWYFGHNYLGGTIVLAQEYSLDLTENIAITDSTDTFKSFVKSLTESVSVSEVFSKTVDYVRTLTENVSITDTLEKTKSFIRTLTENVSITDTISNIKSYIRNVSENIMITESFSYIFVYLLAFNELLGITDTLSKIGVYTRNLLESVGITDTLSKVATMIRSFIEEINSGDTVTKDISQLHIEDITVSEEFDKTNVFTKEVQDNVDVEEDFNKDLVLGREFIENLVVDEEFVKNITKHFQDGISLTELIIVGIVYTRTLLETLPITETISRVKTIYRDLLEELGTTDTVSKLQTKNLSDNVSVRDRISRWLNGRLIIWSKLKNSTLTTFTKIKNKAATTLSTIKNKTTNFTALKNKSNTELTTEKNKELTDWYKVPNRDE